MRVLVVGADPVSEGAYSVRVRAVVRWLAQRGHAITLVSAVDVPSDDEVRRSCREVYSWPFQRQAWSAGWTAQRLLSLPDIYGPWARRVVRELPPRLAGNLPDVILISSPPHGIQLLGTRLSEVWNVAYVADLRDDWLGNHRMRWYSPLHRCVAKAEERRVVRQAAAIVVNTAEMGAQFIERHPDAAAKCVTVTNGFNEEEFKGLVYEGGGRERTRVGYIGSNYNGFVSRVLSDIAHEFVSCGEQDKWQIVCCPGEAERGGALPSGMWQACAPMGPAASAKVMCDCDVLVLLMPPGEREPSPTVPLKAYSYLRAGASIVYSGEKGAPTSLLCAFEGTACLPRSTGRELAQFLRQHRERWGRRYVRENLEYYSFESVSARLEGVLEAAASTTLRSGARDFRCRSQRPDAEGE